MSYKKPAIEIVKEPRRSRIKRIGVELEGGWIDLPKDVVYVGHNHPRVGQIGRDGSLDPLAARNPNIPYLGELPSPPMKESEVEGWLREHWPVLIGPECGFHIHISVENAWLYMKLMDDEAYPATVVEYFRKWAVREGLPKDDPIWDRLDGKSLYCQHLHMPDAQVKNTRKNYDKVGVGHRYTAINFAYARTDIGAEKGGLGTIECRLLSMPKTVDQGISAVKEFTRITNGFLLAGAKREKKQTSAFTVDATSQIDRFIVRV